MNREVESKASRHHDLIQEKQKNEQIKKRAETKLEIKKKKIEEEEKKKLMHRLSLDKNNSLQSPTDINKNVSNLKKMKRKHTEVVELEDQRLNDDDNDTIDDKESYQSNLKEMIDKLNDLKYKTSEWQKTNENIVDQDDTYLRNKRREKERSKERTENLIKDKGKHGRKDGSNDKLKDKSMIDSIQ